MSEESDRLVQRVVEAIRAVEIGYDLRLVALVRGVATYEMVYSDSDQTLQFSSHAAGLDHYRERIGRARAVAAIKELRKPGNIFPEQWCEMIDKAVR